MSVKALAEHAGGVLINVGAFAIFLTAFFFTVGSWIERLAVESQLEIIVDQGINGAVLDILGANTAGSIRKAIGDITLPDMAVADRAAARRNEALMTKALQVAIPAGVLTMFAGAVLVGLGTRRSVKIYQSLSMAAMMILAVFMVELAFALLVSRSYKTTPTSWAAAQFLDALLRTTVT